MSSPPAGDDAQLQERYGMMVKTSNLLQRRLSKGGKGQYFDSGDYNMQGGKPASGGGAAGAGGPKEAAGPVQSKLASSAAPAVTPGPGPARIPQRRKSQPSKLGADQPSPTSPKPTSPMAGP